MALQSAQFLSFQVPQTVFIAQMGAKDLPGKACKCLSHQGDVMGVFKKMRSTFTYVYMNIYLQIKQTANFTAVKNLFLLPTSLSSLNINVCPSEIPT